MLTRNRPPFRVAIAKDIPSHHRGHSVAIWAQGELYLKASIWRKPFNLLTSTPCYFCLPAFFEPGLRDYADLHENSRGETRNLQAQTHVCRLLGMQVHHQISKKDAAFCWVEGVVCAMFNMCRLIRIVIWLPAFLEPGSFHWMNWMQIPFLAKQGNLFKICVHWRIEEHLMNMDVISLHCNQ